MLMRVKGVNKVTAKGNIYYYHRKTGRRIKAPAGTAKFVEEVEFLNGLAEKSPQDEKPGTLGALITAYRSSPEYQAKAKATKTGYESVFDWLAPIQSTALVEITPPIVIEMRDKAFREHKRRFANYVVQVIRLVFNWGGGARQLVAANPAVNVPLIRRPRTAGVANRAWTEAELTAMLDAAKGGMKAAIALGAYAGTRLSDAIRLPWSIYAGGWIRFEQQKTGTPVAFPAHRELRKILDATKRESMVIVVTNKLRKEGKPATTYTVDGFKTAFQKLRNELQKEGKIGKGITFHGLRSTIGKMLDEAGADPKTIAVMLGHTTTQMAEHYSKEGDRTRRGVTAVTTLERKKKAKCKTT